MRAFFSERGPMTYEETIAYIHSAYWNGSKDGLLRTQELLSLLGNPQDDLRFVHVAGTNGKGSTCAMIASILQAAGYRTGRYTSPFVNRFNERIALDGRPIPDGDLVDLFERIRPIVDAMPNKPSEFELITCAAMLYYKEQRCDVVVLEVGMGGEFDSTNVIKTPLLTVITAMGFDHMKYLGSTMAEIASAKAGIIKPGGTTLIYGENPEADEVFRMTCERVGSRLVVTDHSRITDHSHTLKGHDLSFGPYEHLRLPLIGSHQVKNAAVVLTAVEELKKAGLSIPDEAVYEGMATVRWPARMELLSDKPVFLLDGGHNPHGFAAAAETLQELFPDQKITVMMGVMADKDHGDMIRHLLPHAKRFIAVRPDSPRAMTAEALADEIRSLGGQADPAGTVKEGVKKMLNEASQDDVILVIGSLYMAGDVRAAMGKGEQSMDIQLIALDIDDTLVDHSSIIPPRSLAALRRAQEQGVEIVLATGRGYLGTEAIRKQLGEGFHYIICFGGALVADYATGAPRIHRFLAEEDVAACIRIANDLGLHVQIYQGDEVIFQRMTPFVEQYCAFQKLPWRVDEHMLEHDLSSVPKVLIYAPPEQEEQYKKQVAERLPAHLHALGSKPGFIEIGNVSVTKGSAVKALSEALGIDRTKTCAIGDNTLDQDMIEWAGIGCCVENGKQAVKAAADMVIPAQKDEGVAWFIEKYVLKDQA